MENKKLINKRVRICVKWTSKRQPYIWDLYHYLVNWCDSFSKMSSGFSELTILKDYCSYTFIFFREGDYSKDLVIICNNYHPERFRKLQMLLRKYFKKYILRFEKPRDFNKDYKKKEEKENSGGKFFFSQL